MFSFLVSVRRLRWLRWLETLTKLSQVSFLHQLNRLKHPGIVRMVDVEVVQNVFHLAMEWIPFNFSVGESQESMELPWEN